MPTTSVIAIDTDRPRGLRTAAERLVSLDRITKVYRRGAIQRTALADVTLEIHRGEFLSSAGPSGAGKSTLLSLLGLIDTPTSGRYTLLGTSVDGLQPIERARLRSRTIGFVFQGCTLLDDLTAVQNVEVPLVYAGVPVAERKRRSIAALERVGAADCVFRHPAELSGGQQQLVTIARALVTEPALVLADEPTGSLDSRSGDAVMDLLLDLHGSGTTVVLVTHDRRYAALATRTLHLFDGRLADAAIAALAAL
jgi:putative ABC transport system ATP-binding protein